MPYIFHQIHEVAGPLIHYNIIFLQPQKLPSIQIFVVFCFKSHKYPIFSFMVP